MASLLSIYFFLPGDGWATTLQGRNVHRPHDAVVPVATPPPAPVAAPAASPEGGVFWFPNWLEAEFTKAGDHGVTPFFNYWGVFLGNPVGGMTREAAYTHEMLFGVTFDMEKLVGWKGASFKISGAEATGRNLSTDIGNVFNVSESYVNPTGLFYELFYKQTLFDDFLEFKIGRIVAADDFCTLPAFGIQVNGGINGNPTSLFMNSNFTSSPNATWGATLKVKPTPITYVNSGIYQATDRLGHVAYHGLDFSIRQGDGILMFFETGWTPTFGATPETTLHDKDGKTSVTPANPGLPGIYKIGGYYSDFPLVSGTNPDISETNTYGFYLIGQQTVWQSEKNTNHNLALWAGITYSPQLEVSPMPIMGFGGTVWQGLIPGRDQDQFLCTWLTGGLGSSFSPAPAQAGSNPTAETVFDVSYVINLTPNVFIQPDIQYIIQPNGTGTENALVIGAQFGCNF
jgi:porin